MQEAFVQILWKHRDCDNIQSKYFQPIAQQEALDLKSELTQYQIIKTFTNLFEFAKEKGIISI